MDEILESFITSASSTLDKPIKTHLSNVYKNLTITLSTAAVGYMFGMYIPSIIDIPVSIISLLITTFASDRNKRLIALYTMGGATGSIAYHNVSHLMNQNVAAASVFYLLLGIVVPALFASIRFDNLILMWGLPLLSVVILYSFINPFFYFPMEGVLSLLLGILYLLVDSAMIVKRAKGLYSIGAVPDDISDTLTIFSDCVHIFYELLSFLKERERKEKKRRN